MTTMGYKKVKAAWLQGLVTPNNPETSLKRKTCAPTNTDLYKAEKVRKLSSQSSAEIKYDCDDCRITFSNIAHFKRHLEAMHSDDSSSVCDVCAKEFKRYDNFKRQAHSKLRKGCQRAGYRPCKGPANPCCFVTETRRDAVSLYVYFLACSLLLIWFWVIQFICVFRCASSW